MKSPKHRRRRVYFDCNVFDSVVGDQRFQSLLIAGINRSGIQLCFSPINLDEIYGIARHPERYLQVLDWLRVIREVVHGRVLAEPWIVWERAGAIAMRRQKAHHLDYFGPRHLAASSTQRLIDHLLSLSFEKIAPEVNEINRKKVEGKRTFAVFQENVRAALRSRSSLNFDVDFERFASIATQDRLFGFTVSSKLQANPRALRWAARQRIEPLETVSRLTLFRVWAEVVRNDPAINASTKFGYRDMQQAAYLPAVHKFVTEDDKFALALKGSAPGHARRVVSIDEFTSWLTSLPRTA